MVNVSCNQDDIYEDDKNKEEEKQAFQWDID